MPNPPRWSEDIHLELHLDRPARAQSRIPGHPQWRIEVEFDLQGEQDEQMVIKSLSITPVATEAPTGGLTARELRRVRLGELLRQVSAGAAGTFLTAALNVANSHAEPHPAHPGRRGHDTRFYAEWAARYTQEVARTPRPVAALADRHHLPQTRIRQYINRARALGLLTRPPAGRCGGELTTQAHQLLHDTSPPSHPHREAETASLLDARASPAHRSPGAA